MRFIATLALALLCSAASATFKPEYGKNPLAVQNWFENAVVPGWHKYQACMSKRPLSADSEPWQKACALKFSPAYMRLDIAGCCKNADRLKTKFVAGKNADEWAYYPDPACTNSGCPLLPINPDVIESTPIEPAKKDLVGLTDVERAIVEDIFKQIRTEGVLFIYHGAPACFWPPEPSI